MSFSMACWAWKPDDHVREGGIEADVVEHDAMRSRLPQQELCLGPWVARRGGRRHGPQYPAYTLSTNESPPCESLRVSRIDT